jgi:hypothetical protein
MEYRQNGAKLGVNPDAVVCRYVHDLWCIGCALIEEPDVFVYPEPLLELIAHTYKHTASLPTSC